MVHGFAGEFQTNHQRFTRGPRLNAVQITREFHGVGRHRHRTLSAVNGVVEQRGVAVEFGRPFRQRLGGRKRSRAQGVVQTGGDAVHWNQQAVACLQLAATVSLDAVKAHDVARDLHVAKSNDTDPCGDNARDRATYPADPQLSPFGQSQVGFDQRIAQNTQNHKAENERHRQAKPPGELRDEFGKASGVQKHVRQWLPRGKCDGPSHQSTEHVQQGGERTLVAPPERGQSNHDDDQNRQDHADAS